MSCDHYRLRRRRVRALVARRFTDVRYRRRDGHVDCHAGFWDYDRPQEIFLMAMLDTILLAVIALHALRDRR
jgi:hypothetical protein